MTTDQIIQLVITIFPDALAIFTTVGVIVKVIKSFKELKKQVTDNKPIEEMNRKLDKVMTENYELKKKLNELLTKIDHVERK